MSSKKNLLPKVEDKFDRRCTDILYAILRRRRKVSQKIPTDKWSAQFRLLRVEDGVHVDRIQKVLNWYTRHIRDQYTPKAYSAKSFRLKFFDIEDAMEREQRQGTLFDEQDFEVVIVKDDEDGDEIEINWN